jgi:hypothetical protein
MVALVARVRGLLFLGDDQRVALGGLAEAPADLDGRRGLVQPR